MFLHGHYFRKFGEVERICRCGFVVGADETPDQIEQRMRQCLGYVASCSGEWHVFPPLHGDICIDCDGARRYPSGASCKRCRGSGRVPVDEGIPIPIKYALMRRISPQGGHDATRLD